MPMHTYNRRPLPPDPLKHFLDVELISIAQAIKDAQAGATPTGPTTVFLTSDVSNNASATNLASGLKANVVAGSTYTFRWYLVFNSNANTGGVLSVVTHSGAYTTAVTHSRGNTTGVATVTETITTATGNPVTTATYVSYSGVGVVMIDHTLVASASGTVELAFHPVTNGQNYTLKAGSYLQVFGPT